MCKQVMKNKILYTIAGIFTIFIAVSFTTVQTTNKYKCMLQLNAYDGEGAYIVISLLNPEGKYEKTLQILGDDPEWYSDITQWWRNYQGRKRENVDAISGATISGGERAIKLLNIAEDKINSGYKIRFETIVEEQNYYVSDVEFELTTESLNSTVKGNGYIKYIRLMPQ